MKRQQWQGFLLVGPAVILLAAIFIVPLVQLIFYSFWGQLEGSFLPDMNFTTENYQRILGDEYYAKVYWRTVRISLIATPIMLLMGYPLARFISRQRGSTKGFLMALVVIPMFGGVMIQTLGWISLLLPYGVINGALKSLGLIETAIPFLGNESGVIIGLVQGFLPLMLLPLVTSLSAIDPSMEEAAKSLGASSWRAFLEVTLPLSLPGAIAGTVLVEAANLTSFVTPSMLGKGKIQVFGTLVYQQSAKALDWPFASAFTLLFVGALALAAILVLVAVRAVQRLRAARRTSSEASTLRPLPSPRVSA